MRCSDFSKGLYPSTPKLRKPNACHGHCLVGRWASEAAYGLWLRRRFPDDAIIEFWVRRYHEMQIEGGIGFAFLDEHPRCWKAHSHRKRTHVPRPRRLLDAVHIQPRFWGNPLQRKRYLRGLYNGAPLFVRPYALFFYRYFLRLGFLDGREGLIFWTLQTFWFRFLIDSKLFEHRKNKKV